MALPELRGGEAVQLEDLGHRRTAVWPHRAVAGRRGRTLRDAAHADRVVVPASHEGGPGRRAQRCRVEAVVLEPVRCQALGGRRVDGPTKRARGTEADVVEQHDEDIRGARRGPQRLDGRERRVRVLGVVRGQPDPFAIRDWQDAAGMLVRRSGHRLLSCGGPERARMPREGMVTNALRFPRKSRHGVMRPDRPGLIVARS